MAAHPTTFLPLASGYAPLMGHHRHLLDDHVRTTAFLRAIAKVVKRGDVVVDVGTGTGILAIAARRAGAATVFAIEREPVIHVARAIAEANHVDGITWIEAHSRDVVLPECADVIISECFGVLAIGGTMIESVIELRARSGAPRVLPASVTVRAAPVESPADHAYVDVWAKRRYGLAWSPAAAFARNNLYNTAIVPRGLLARAASLCRIELARDAYAGAIRGAARFVARPGTVHGFAAWFDSELGGGVTLSTAPGRAPTIWRQVFLPIEPVVLRARTAIELELDYDRGQFAWRGTIGDRAFAHDTRASYPATSEP
jgi:threonine dehydrogenase-like Zn-dependent dehydrogenase